MSWPLSGGRVRCPCRAPWPRSWKNNTAAAENRLAYALVITLLKLGSVSIAQWQPIYLGLVLQDFCFVSRRTPRVLGCSLLESHVVRRY